MIKIKMLHSFILDLNLFAAAQMDSEVDDLVITPSCRPHPTAGQIIVAEKDYTATFYIERYPHKAVSEDALLAQVSAWLVENDSERTQPIEFPIIVEVLDTSTANIEFGIAFNEHIMAVQDVNGDIEVKGVRYALL